MKIISSSCSSNHFVEHIIFTLIVGENYLAFETFTGVSTAVEIWTCAKLGASLGSAAGPVGFAIGAVAGAAVGWVIDEFGDAIIDWVVGWLIN